MGPRRAPTNPRATSRTGPDAYLPESSKKQVYPRYRRRCCHDCHHHQHCYHQRDSDSRLWPSRCGILHCWYCRRVPTPPSSMPNQAGLPESISKPNASLALLLRTINATKGPPEGGPWGYLPQGTVLQAAPKATAMATSEPPMALHESGRPLDTPLHVNRA